MWFFRYGAQQTKFFVILDVFWSFTYTGQKLNSRFQIKDKINKKDKHDLKVTGTLVTRLDP